MLQSENGQICIKSFKILLTKLHWQSQERGNGGGVHILSEYNKID